VAPSDEQDPAQRGASPESPPRTPERQATAPETPSRQRFAAIHHALRERIARLEYPPGTRLDVNRLAGEFAVSRTPVRSVLQRLEHQGLVVTRHGVGTTVTPLDVEHLREAIELRVRLAELIGELSPRRPHAGVLEHLDAAAERCRPLLARFDPEGFARVDIGVHRAVCGLIGNARLLDAYDELFYRTVRMWFVLLPRLDWREEVSVLLEDIAMMRRTVARGDARGTGYVVRNALSAALLRLGESIAHARTGD